MGEVYRVTFTLKKGKQETNTALTEFLKNYSQEHVLVERFTGLVYG